MKSHEHDLPPQLPEGRHGRFCRFCTGTDRLRRRSVFHRRHRVSGTAGASSEAASSAVAGETFKVGIVNYVDHASLNQIVASVESRLDELGKEKGVTFDYADYYANAQADQSNLNQIGADLVADGVDVIVAVATPTAATNCWPLWKIPRSRRCTPPSTDAAAAGFDGGENMTGTSERPRTPPPS